MDWTVFFVGMVGFILFFWQGFKLGYKLGLEKGYQIAKDIVYPQK